MSSHPGSYRKRHHHHRHPHDTSSSDSDKSSAEGESDSVLSTSSASCSELEERKRKKVRKRRHKEKDGQSEHKLKKQKTSDKHKDKHKRKRKHKKTKQKHKGKESHKQTAKHCSQGQEEKEDKNSSFGPAIIPSVLTDESAIMGPSKDPKSSSALTELSPAVSRRSLAPMTKEEYERQQSVVRRVFDPETGRNRLVKGDGEVLEEIVSREQQRAINKRATLGDSLSFQAGLKKLI